MGSLIHPVSKLIVYIYTMESFIFKEINFYVIVHSFLILGFWGVARSSPTKAPLFFQLFIWYFCIFEESFEDFVINATVNFLSKFVRTWTKSDQNMANVNFWENDLHGQGTYKWPNGQSYESSICKFQIFCFYSELSVGYCKQQEVSSVADIILNN